MDDLRERIFLLIIRELFSNHLSIAKSILMQAGSATALFDSDRPQYIAHFAESAALWKRFMGSGKRDFEAAGLELKKIEAHGLSMVSLTSPEYPELLRQIADPPCLLLARGKGIDSLRMPMIAMVGSRRASARAMDAASEIAMGLAERGYAVASGMAYGIDSASHRGALAGGGATVAVMGCGAEQIYPPGNARLSQAIAEQGLIVSEFPVGTPPFKQHFPQRNRIISGMALATVVVEAAAMSGSLITARFALEQDREVMAVPGPGGTDGARGVNALIRDGAPLVETAEEVAAIVDPLLSGRSFLKSSGQFKGDVDMHSALFRAVPSRGFASVDELIAKTGMKAAELLAELSKLCMDGAIEEAAGRRWRRTR